MAKTKLFLQRITVLILGLSTALVLLAADYPNASDKKSQEGHIRVYISGVRQPKGQILCALFRHRDDWLDRIYQGARAKQSSQGRVICDFPKVPHGHYALSLFHDVNSNTKLDKNWLGIPKEGYGFSRDPSIGFGPPGWDETVFTHKGKMMRLSSKLRYP